jgi:hypothetical protein
MADWTMISSLATGFGTMVLAIATFSSVRSSNRTARIAQESLSVGLRPLLMPSRFEDSTEAMRWGDGRWTKVEGGKGLAEVDNEIVYLAMSVRNVADGMAVLQAWHAEGGTADAPFPGSSPAPLWSQPAVGFEHPLLDEFRRQGRDLYVPSRDVSFWQGALRDPHERGYDSVRRAIEAEENITIHLMYSDHEGGQRVISRFTLTPKHEGKEWICSVVRHWNLDRDDPR